MSSTSRTRRSTRSTTAPSASIINGQAENEAQISGSTISDTLKIPTKNAARTRKTTKAPTSTTHRAGPDRDRYTSEPTFEIVVLGSGGGPLETDCSGYLVKAAKSKWEDGVLAVEGGSGLGALASILERRTPSDIFPGLKFPKTHNTPILKAAHVFSLLACYLITHAHLDHVGSLIMLSGSVPPRNIEHTQPSKASTRDENSSDSTPPARDAAHPRPHVYGTRKTLEQLSQAYQGGLWPELGSWVPDREGESNDTASARKRRKLGTRSHDESHSRSHEHTPSPDRAQSHSASPGRESMGKVNGANGPVEPSEENYKSCLIFSPLSIERVHRPLHPTLPITLLTYPVAHGCTSKHTYESSAMFIRYDPGAITQPDSSPSSLSLTPNGNGSRIGPDAGREFLFFGDVESSYRRPGEEGVDVERGKEAEEMNKAIWKEAAKSWEDGRLCGIFIECSYDSSRPAHLMFGHLSPPAVYHELEILASMVSAGSSDSRPLGGLKIFITHIKDALVPHPTGKTAREIIMGELDDLEAKGRLGVEFVETKKGDRIEI
ncbi:hypothetical protein IAU59_006843 [Kwoniella sp. CBS 9459]